MNSPNKNMKAWMGIQLAACVLTSALLLFLFIFPSSRLNALESDLTALADAVEVDAMQEKWSDVSIGTMSMLHRFQRDQTLLRYVLDHEDTDRLELHIKSAIKLASAEELSQLLSELEGVKNVVKFIANIERASLEGIL